MEAIMSNITRVDPLSGNLDDLFKGLFVRPMRLELDAPQEMQIRMDVTRADDAYRIVAEMPGVKKEDIHVTVEGSQVTIMGEVKKETEERKGEEVVRKERYYGKVSRSFMMPQDIDESRVVAKYEDGLLTLTLPNRVKSSAKKIAVV